MNLYPGALTAMPGTHSCVPVPLDNATIGAVFGDAAGNWTRSVVPANDIRQEIAIEESADAPPVLAAIDRASVLLP